MIQLEPSGIKEIEEISQTTDGCISLSQGVLRIGGISKQIKKYLQTILETDKADYYATTHLSNLLKQKIIKNINQRYNITFSSDQILLTHGCIGGLSAIVPAICEAGDEVLLPEPTYPLYKNIVRLAKANPIFVSYLADTLNNNISWQFPIEKIKKKTTNKTKAILFSNPSNPTGQIISKKILLELISWCETNGIYLIVDEVYEDYVFDEIFTSAVSFIPKSKFIIRASSFSKNFSMSGWRIGYMVVPKQLTNLAEIANYSLIVSPSVLGHWGALHALDHPEITKSYYDIIYSNLLFLNEKLHPLVKNGIFAYQRPSAGIFVFIRTRDENTMQHCLEMINKHKVSTIPGKYFGPTGIKFFRICFARSRKILEEGINRVINYWTH